MKKKNQLTVDRSIAEDNALGARNRHSDLQIEHATKTKATTLSKTDSSSKVSKKKAKKKVDSTTERPSRLGQGALLGFLLSQSLLFASTTHILLSTLNVFFKDVIFSQYVRIHTLFIINTICNCTSSALVRLLIITMYYYYFLQEAFLPFFICSIGPGCMCMYDLGCSRKRKWHLLENSREKAFNLYVRLKKRIT